MRRLHTIPERPQVKVANVDCPQTLPYELIEDEGKCFHVVRLSAEVVSDIREAVKPRKINSEASEAILTHNISRKSRRFFDSCQKAATALAPFIDVHRAPDGATTVSKKSSPGATIRATLFNLYVEQHEDETTEIGKSEGWVIVVTIEG
jgi:hypothetical protein